MGLRKVENIVTYFIFVSRPNVVITFCQLTFLYVTRRLLLAHPFLWVLVSRCYSANVVNWHFSNFDASTLQDKIYSIFPLF